MAHGTRAEEVPGDVGNDAGFRKTAGKNTARNNHTHTSKRPSTHRARMHALTTSCSMDSAVMGTSVDVAAILLRSCLSFFLRIILLTSVAPHCSRACVPCMHCCALFYASLHISNY